MAALALSAPYQEMSAINNRPSLQSSASAPAPPFEGIVDFSQTHQHHQHLPLSHASFGPFAAASDMAYSHQHQRSDATEWKQPSFFSYRPNEVKHRKRTTRQQLKVLEETFKTTQKPDANVRKSLAAQLDMTPRNVQVWFQNRRAKDKTLAKRAQKLVEDVQGMHSASLDALSPSAEADQLNDTFAPSTQGQYSASAHYTASSVHSGSTSPVDGTFPKLEVPTPVRVSQDIIAQPQPFHAASSATSASFSSFELDDTASSVVSSDIHAHGPFAVDEASHPLNYSRQLFTPRHSLPHIHTPYQQDLQQHQRSYSYPEFSNVDTTSNLSMTTCASINGVLYPQRLASSLSQQPAQSVYNTSYSASVPRVSSGPLPRSDFTFGAPETERDSESASYARYQLGSVSGTDTPSSLSGLSQYGSVASLVDSEFASLAGPSFEDDASSAPTGWQSEQRRGSAPHGVRPVLANQLGREISPSSDPESDSSVYLPNRSTWTPAYPEESKTNVKPTVGYQQQETFNFNGYVDHVEAAFASTFMPTMETAAYSSQTASSDVLGNQFVGYGSERIPFGGYRPLTTAGYQFA